MSGDLTTTDVLVKVGLTQSDQTTREFTSAGINPESVASSDVKKNIIILEVTPEDFSSQYASAEFDFEALKEAFTKYCKDFNEDLKEGMPSKALEFSGRMTFELGPYIRNEKKSKGDKAIRFKFPYKKTEDGVESLGIKVVIVSTFRENIYKGMEQDNKLILTFKQAGMLAMVSFLKAVEFSYSSNMTYLMTPLCGAVFSRDSIADMAKELHLEEVKVTRMINSSSSTGGQYMHESDMACAIVCTISTTKRVANKDVRNQMITKVIKQYCAKHKDYISSRFAIFAKYALGGVPPGMDAETLIENFSNIQTANVNARAQAISIAQSMMKVAVPSATYETAVATEVPSKSSQSTGTSAGTIVTRRPKQ